MGGPRWADVQLLAIADTIAAVTGGFQPPPGFRLFHHVRSALAHMLRADAEAAYAPGSRTGPPAVLRSMSRSVQEQAGAVRREPGAGPDRSASRYHASPGPGPQHGRGITGPGPRPAHGQAEQAEQARMIARRLAAAGRPVSRRALRSGGVTGSNEALTSLARLIKAELAGCASGGQLGGERHVPAGHEG